MDRSWICGSCGMKNMTDGSCSDCGEMRRQSRRTELTLLIGGQAFSDESAPPPPPAVVQSVNSVPEMDRGPGFRPFIVFGNMVVALAILLILGTVSFFIGIVAVAFM